MLPGPQMNYPTFSVSIEIYPIKYHRLQTFNSLHSINSSLSSHIWTIFGTKNSFLIEYIFNNWNITCGCSVKPSSGRLYLSSFSISKGALHLPSTSSLSPKQSYHSIVISSLLVNTALGDTWSKGKRKVYTSKYWIWFQNIMSQLMETREQVFTATQTAPLPFSALFSVQRLVKGMLILLINITIPRTSAIFLSNTVSSPSKYIYQQV